MPVEGNWITITVVAEWGPIRTTRAPVDAAPKPPKSYGKNMST